ncbi:MAG: very short patch repair endonuclease [Candidatus Paceibacterota bacterium]|jgi:DNA mismatch endonuclease (patch repair protein)
MIRKRIKTPVATSVAVSNVMKANKSTNTKPELLMRRHLSLISVRGYRLHWKKAPGKPDIAFPGRKIAVVVNGCFWHGCRKCGAKMPKTNKAFWSQKILGNRRRDERNLKTLRGLGWKVFVVWEHDLKKGKGVAVANQIRVFVDKFAAK